MSDDTVPIVGEDEGASATFSPTSPAPDEPLGEVQEVGAPVETAPVEQAEETVRPVTTPEPVQAPVIEPVSEALAPEPQVREVIIEKEKPLTEADKDAIFQNKLKDNLAGANTRKQQKHEARLQEIVDFIRKKGTLVTNQDIEEGLKIIDTTVTRRLNELIQRGTLMRLGDQRHAKYKLIDAV